MAKQVIHGEDSRAAILRGVNQLADGEDRAYREDRRPGAVLGGRQADSENEPGRDAEDRDQR